TRLARPRGGSHRAARLRWCRRAEQHAVAIDRGREGEGQVRAPRRGHSTSGHTTLGTACRPPSPQRGEGDRGEGPERRGDGGENRAGISLVLGVKTASPHASRNSKAFFTNAWWYWKTPPCPASS